MDGILFLFLSVYYYDHYFMSESVCERQERQKQDMLNSRFDSLISE